MAESIKKTLIYYAIWRIMCYCVVLCACRRGTKPEHFAGQTWFAPGKKTQLFQAKKIPPSKSGLFFKARLKLGVGLGGPPPRISYVKIAKKNNISS